MIDKIILNNVKKQYKNFQLGELSFSIPKGYITGFIGKNGQGKTTTIKSILSFINFDGDILIDGIPNLKLEFIKETGIVMDEPFLSKDWSINLVNQAMEIGYEKWDSSQFFDLIKRFDIPLTSKVGELSRGMKIKLMLSVALSHKANLLILDEPTSGLDPSMRDEFVDIIQEFMEYEDNTVLFSTHITQDLEAIADYIVFLDEGKLVQFASKEDFINSYKIIKGSLAEFEELDKESLLGYKTSSIGFEGLVKGDEQDDLLLGLAREKTSIEKIMILYRRKGWWKILLK